MNIIFLDVDGVLNSAPYFEEQKKNADKYEDIGDFHVQLLAEIYHECDAKIVLCSTWRNLEEDDSLYQYLVRKLKEHGMEIVSKTDVIDYKRPEEIRAWLDMYGEGCNYVILDDDFGKEYYDEYGLGEHLVRTLFFCNHIFEGGLQQKHVNAAIKILKG